MKRERQSATMILQIFHKLFYISFSLPLILIPVSLTLSLNSFSLTAALSKDGRKPSWLPFSVSIMKPISPSCPPSPNPHFFLPSFDLSHPSSSNQSRPSSRKPLLFTPKLLEPSQLSTFGVLCHGLEGILIFFF